MLTFEKGYKRKYQYGGSGLLDSIISAVASNTMKEVATEVGKKAATEIGNRATQKVIDKIIPSNRAVLDKHLNNSVAERYKRGEAVAIQDLVRKLNTSVG